MSSSAAIAHTVSHPANALLQERLARVEATLEEARLSVVSSLDRELASVRGWLQALQTFDPTLNMETTAQSDDQALNVQPKLQSLMETEPQAAKSKIVAFNKGDFTSEKTSIPEPVVDPGLEKATIEELNAALGEAFREMQD
ncbi:MAG: hypothetical protein ACAI34_10485 [Verrucomicrobium sp.]|nr:hypothetical protein [Verrucomicrobium sp.]